MSTSTTIPVEIEGNRSNKHNRGRKPRHGRSKVPQSEVDNIKTPAQTETTLEGNTTEQIEENDGTICWICAEPVKFYSVSECNHRTCHVCALRLRALYKRMDCTFCKHPQMTLIFTRSPSDVFESYTPEMIPFKDNKLSIFFETQDMMEETLILLRFNCPDASCDFTAHGWGDLKMHVRGTHGRTMCDMCIRHKKIFAHEHVLYQPSQLPLHLPSISHRSQKNQTSDKVEGGIHPMCEFCRECYLGDDELFAHMRERHEECFVCKSNGTRDQHFLDYNSLERHFESAHFPCKDAQCHAQKFVVFGSALDLKAHIVQQHGGEMTARDRKDARRVEATFDYNNSAVEVARRQGRNRAREREREPPEPGPLQSRRREGFGATLTGTPSGGSPATSSQLFHRQSQGDDYEYTLTDIDPIVTERHTAFIARVNNLTSNSSSAMPAISAAVRSFRSSESGPRDLISTFFNVVNRDLDGTASLISALVELLDDEEKRRALLAAWNGFKLEQQRQFPDLTPGATGSEYAGIAGGRVLNVKHSAAVRSSSNQSARQVWDRVAQAAASSSTSNSSVGSVIRPQERFPTLSAARTTPAHRQSQHTTAWSTASSSRPATQSSGSPPDMTSSRGSVTTAPRAPPPKISHALFPTLPSSGSNKAQRPAVSGNPSLKHILGDTSAPSSAWGSKKDEAVNENSQPPKAENSSEPVPEVGSTKGKKKKGKEKQTLFTFGTFPT